MQSRLKVLATALLFTFTLSGHAEEPRELGWQDLAPEGWTLPPPSSVDHASAFLDQLDALESPAAPTVAELDNSYVKIPGFVLPLEFNGDAVSEFLLVPYIGACLHVPAPPGNQIVYVRLQKPISGMDLYAPVWVQGTIKIQQTESLYAQASYTLTAEEVSEYEWE